MSCALLWGLGDGLQGGLRERGPIANLQPTESQAAYAHALDRCRPPTNKVAHATDLPVAPLGECEAQLRLVQPLDARRPDRLVVEVDVVPQVAHRLVPRRIAQLLVPRHSHQICTRARESVAAGVRSGLLGPGAHSFSTRLDGPMTRSMNLLSVDHNIRPVESASSLPAQARPGSPQGSPDSWQSLKSDFF